MGSRLVFGINVFTAADLLLASPDGTLAREKKNQSGSIT